MGIDQVLQEGAFVENSLGGGNIGTPPELLTVYLSGLSFVVNSLLTTTCF